MRTPNEWWRCWCGRRAGYGFGTAITIPREYLGPNRFVMHGVRICKEFHCD